MTRTLARENGDNRIFIGIGVIGYVNTMYKKVVGCDREKTCGI